MANLETFFDGTAFSDSHVLQPALVLGMLSLAVLGLSAGCIVLPLLVTTGGRRIAACSRSTRISPGSV